MPYETWIWFGIGVLVGFGLGMMTILAYIEEEK